MFEHKPTLENLQLLMPTTTMITTAVIRPKQGNEAQRKQVLIAESNSSILPINSRSIRSFSYLAAKENWRIRKSREVEKYTLAMRRDYLQSQYWHLLFTNLLASSNTEIKSSAAKPFKTHFFTNIFHESGVPAEYPAAWSLLSLNGA